ncbi:hypothetical protein NDA13_006483 [Ustilago tritici]|nr:hypothetical protein NDA13_006483 [Ustilago tritici]
MFRSQSAHTIHELHNTAITPEQWDPLQQQCGPSSSRRLQDEPQSPRPQRRPQRRPQLYQQSQSQSQLQYNRTRMDGSDILLQEQSPVGPRQHQSYSQPDLPRQRSLPPPLSDRDAILLEILFNAAQLITSLRYADLPDLRPLRNIIERISALPDLDTRLLLPFLNQQEMLFDRDRHLPATNLEQTLQDCFEAIENRVSGAVENRLNERRGAVAFGLHTVAVADNCSISSQAQSVARHLTQPIRPGYGSSDRSSSSSPFFFRHQLHKYDSEQAHPPGTVDRHNSISPQLSEFQEALPPWHPVSSPDLTFGGNYDDGSDRFSDDPQHDEYQPNNRQSPQDVPPAEDMTVEGPTQGAAANAPQKKRRKIKNDAKFRSSYSRKLIALKRPRRSDGTFGKESTFQRKF